MFATMPVLVNFYKIIVLPVFNFLSSLSFVRKALLQKMVPTYTTITKSTSSLGNVFSQYHCYIFKVSNEFL